MSGYGAGGTAGYTGIGVTGQDVLIYGNLLVTGGIDPIYLALTPQTSGPTGFTNPLWVDSLNGNALRSEHIYMDNPPSTAYIAIRPDTTNQIILSDGASPTTEIRNTINNSSMTISTGPGIGNSVVLDQQFLTFNSTTTPFIATIGSDYNMQISSTNDLNLTSNNDMNLNSQVDFSVSATNDINLLSSGNITLAPNDNTGDLIFTGTNLESSTGGSATGQLLRIKLNNNYYKIVLYAD
jgi:hypothetical protein